MGIITAILQLFGCSGQPNKNNSANGSDTGSMVSASIQLTEQILDTCSDQNIIELVYEHLVNESAKSDVEYDAVMSWNQSRQAIFMIWGLEAEVNNGGFNQFYINSSGQYAKHLPKALQLIGAIKFADLIQRANLTYDQNKAAITSHLDGTLEGYSKSYENNPLNQLDDEFYELYNKEDLQQLQVAFIRKNKKDFLN